MAEPEPSREALLGFLREHGGQVRNSELRGRFKPLLEAGEPEERAARRQRFTALVNSLAVVRELDGTKFVVLRKKLRREAAGEPGDGETPVPERSVSPAPEGSPPPVPERSVSPAPEGSPPPVPERSVSPAPEGSPPPVPERSVSPAPEGSPPPVPERSVSPAPEGSPPPVPERSVSPAPEGSPPPVPERSVSPAPEGSPPPKPVSLLRGMFQSQEDEAPAPAPGVAGLPKKAPAPKPFMLPLRCPQPARGAEELRRQEEQPGDKDWLQVGAWDLPEPAAPRSPHMKRRQVEEAGARSPHLRRVSKTQKVSEETGCIAAVPLESVEHKWLVKAASGQWSQQLYGLLLSDANLAGKRDFISGFTALHWAAKSGNSDMVGKIIEVAKNGGAQIDVNAKSFGGYTPLHIAAIHGQEEVIATLVKTYNVKVNLRDYSGKKPHHYLKEGSSYAVRYLLGDPDLQNSAGHAFPTKKNPKIAASILSSTSTFLGVLSDDMVFYDLTRGLKKTSSFNKLLNSSVGSKKKSKTRGTFPSYSSLVEAMEEEEEAAVKRRPVSELFFSH